MSVGLTLKLTDGLPDDDTEGRPCCPQRPMISFLQTHKSTGTNHKKKKLGSTKTIRRRDKPQSGEETSPKLGWQGAWQAKVSATKLDGPSSILRTHMVEDEH